MNVIKQSGLLSGHTVHTIGNRPYGLPDVVYHYDSEAQYYTGFKKPDTVVRNAKVNGFRKPSAYAVSLIKVGPNVTNNRDFPVAYHIEGDGWADSTTHWKFEGSNCRPITIPLISMNVNHLRTKLLINIKDEVFDVSMVLAELQSTVSTLSSNLNRVGRSLLALKKGNPKSFYYLLTGKTKDGRRPTQRLLKESSSAFLEWKYGITPTLMDIAGACRALDINASEHGLFSNPPLLVARARMLETVNEMLNLSIAEAAGGGFQTQVPVSFTRDYSARCDYRVEGEYLRGLNRFGLGLGSIATVMWDKTPFTFVLDMALPIADLLKAWSALEGVVVVGYCETDYSKLVIPKHSGRGLARKVPVTYKVVPNEAFWFNRTAYGSPPMPTPYIKNPIKTGNLSTVLALFTQLRRGA